jgi:citronellol/citronellal dehydrogenase
LAIWSAARHDRLQHALPFIGAVNIARGIAVNALWPRTTIATSAIKKFRGDAVMRASRTPDILADAAHAIFLKDAKTFTGNFLIDDTFLFSNGVRDFDRYRVDPGVDLEPDFFVPDDSAPPVSLAKAL